MNVTIIMGNMRTEIDMSPTQFSIIPAKGAKGDTGAAGATGATGNGIASIAKTGTSGLVDTYTITFTNGNTTTFTVTNGSDATVTVDSALSSSSENPVQNKVIKAALDLKADNEPHNYLLDGNDLSEVFADAAALHAAVSGGDFSKIRIGDYWPLSLSGTFRDYGSYTVPSGTTYYSDAALTTSAGTTSSAYEGQYSSATAVSFKISSTTYYAATSDCLTYYARTMSSAVVNLEVAGINNYWRYGDSGDLTGNNKPHITFVSRDCLPFYMRMRKANAVWENAEETNPWRGSALFKTLNDPDYGVIKIIKATTIGAYLYNGPNGGGMRAMMETKASGATTASGWAWGDRGGLFLPFESEIWGHGVWAGNSGYNLGCNLQFPIFAGSRRHISKGIGNGASRDSWWAASSYSGSAASFCYVTIYGAPNGYYAVNTSGAPVCFVMI